MQIINMKTMRGKAEQSIEFHIDLNVKNKDGRTAFHLACGEKSSDIDESSHMDISIIVEELLQNFDELSNPFWTPLVG